ncbi:MAG: hypothetical protein FJ255_11555 [Phycisphaerae bacterium]|nr:hypothetical protein [Phycisphaerae bacterium]
MIHRMQAQPRPNPTLAHARRLYANVLPAWASDLLELRRRGLHVPGARGHAAWCAPGTPFAARSPARQHARPGVRRAA